MPKKPKSPSKSGKTGPPEAIVSVDVIDATVLFKARNSTSTDAGEVPCSPGKLLMSPPDLKALGVKMGEWVTLRRMDETTQLLRAWPSKGNLQHNVTLHRVWQPFLEEASDSIDDSKAATSPRYVTRSASRAAAARSSPGGVNRKVSITAGPALVLSIPCSSIRIEVGSAQHLPLVQTAPFQRFVLAHLQGLPLPSRGVRLGIHWRGAVETVSIIPVCPENATLTDVGDHDHDNVWHVVDDTAQVTAAVRRSGIDRQEPGIVKVPILAFGGYEDQRRQALALLGIALEQRKSPSTTSPQQLPAGRGLLVHGAHGTGKSRFVRSIATELGCKVLVIDATILCATMVGEAERRLLDTFHTARTSPGKWMIAIEGAECIFAVRKDASELQQRLVTALLSLMDGFSAQLPNSLGKYVVVGVCVDPLKLDPAFRRTGRFDVEIEIGVPSRDDRMGILAVMCAELCPGLPHQVQTQLADQAHGMVASDLEVVIKLAVSTTSTTPHPSSSSQAPTPPLLLPLEQDLSASFKKLSMDDKSSGGVLLREGGAHVSWVDVSKALKQVTPSGLREISVEVPNVRWHDIGGMDYVKQSLREVVEWPLKHGALFKSMGLRSPRGVMLFGPPGCSKTLMAKALATESSMNFLAVRGPELMSKYLGESERAVQRLFRRARAAAPSIVFFDEIDALAGVRGSSDSGVNDRVLSQLLTELDGAGVSDTGPQVIVVIATNRPDMLDPALTRPGRIDRKIYVSPPDEESRRQILTIELSRQPLESEIMVDGGGKGLDELIASTNGFSGAEVVAVCSEAVLMAQDEGKSAVAMTHLRGALAQIEPQITPSMLAFYDEIVTKQR